MKINKITLIVLAAIILFGIKFLMQPTPPKPDNMYLDLFEDSEVADTDNTTKFKNSYFSFNYPKNWELDTNDPDYDQDASFDINAPATGKILFQIIPSEISAEEIISELESAYKDRLMSKPVVTHFETWGSQKGYGIELDGEILSVKGKIRVFGFTYADKTIYLVETRYKNDEAYNAKGYDLIANTFALH